MSKICMIAHRGYSAKYPDNTAVAFEKAAENGSGGAETDVRITKDGVFVACHNPEAAFADGTELLVSESTFDELTAKPLLNKKSDDVVYLCTFKRYLEIMKENNMVCFIELKGSYTDEQVKAVFGLAASVYDLSKCILQSFDFDNLIKCREMFPDLPLMYTYGSEQTDYERCFEYGIAIDADSTVITQAMVDEFHAHGLEVGVWTVNTADELERISAMGVDYIESDCFGG